MTYLSHWNHKFVTVHNKCSKIPLSTSMHFVTCVQISCVFVWVDLYVCSCGQQHPKCEWVIVDSNSSISVTMFVRKFFPHNDWYYHIQNIDLSSLITLYKFYWQKIWSSYGGLYLDDSVIKCDAMCLCVWEPAFLVQELPLSSGRKSTINLILGCSSMVMVLVCQTVWLSVLGKSLG